MDVDDPSDWPDRDLAQLEQLLRCTICRDWFATPMLLLGCAHTFCSLCIRRSLEYERTCPQCRQPSEPAQLRNNRLVESIVNHFVAMRPGLLRRVRAAPGVAAHKTCNGAASPAPEPPATAAIAPAAEPQPQLQADKVHCPICQGVVKLTGINEHIDSGCQRLLLRTACESALPATLAPPRTSPVPQRSLSAAGAANGVQPAENGAERRRPLAKLPFDMLKDQQIRKHLRDHNLRATGDRVAMVWRLKEFVLRYNASCDSDNPPPEAEIVRSIDEDEKRRARPPSGSAATAASSVRAQPQRASSSSSDPADPDDPNNAYVRSHKDQFEALVAQARARAAKRTHDETEAAPAAPSPAPHSACASADTDDDAIFRAIVLPEPEPAPAASPRKRTRQSAAAPPQALLVDSPPGTPILLLEGNGADDDAYVPPAAATGSPNASPSITRRQTRRRAG